MRGPKGERGAKGGKGERGKNGITRIIRQTITFKGWVIDTTNFTVKAVLSDGSETPVLELGKLFESYQNITNYAGYYYG